LETDAYLHFDFSPFSLDAGRPLLRNSAFLLGSFIFLIILIVDGGMFFVGMKVLGIFSIISSILVFASGMVWLIYRDDAKIYIRHKALVFPIAIFGIAILTALKQVPVDLQLTPENLEQTGNLLMSRYQIGLWIVAALIFFIFVMASSLLSGDRR
jgi:hypothetical protein